MTRGPSVALLSHLASPRAPTGAERSLALLATGLARRGHRVAVAVPGPWALTGDVVAAGVQVATIRHHPCWLTYFKPRPWPIVTWKWLRWRLAARSDTARLAAWLELQRPDVVHVNCLPHLSGAAAVRRLGRPGLWHLREILPEGPRRRRFARHLRRFPGPLVAVSEAVARWVRAEGLGERVTVVHNGVQVPEQAPDRAAARRALGLDADALLVAYLGQLGPHKGLDQLLEACAAAAVRVPALRVALAGDGPPHTVAALRRHIASLPTPDRVTLLPPQPAPEMLLAAADLVAVPTLTPDPLPRAVLEAMAAARPVVATATGGIPEMVEPGVTGLLVPPGDAAGLATALARLATDADLRTRFGEAGHRRAEALFSLDAHLDRLEALLATTAGARQV